MEEPGQKKHHAMKALHAAFIPGNAGGVPILRLRDALFVTAAWNGAKPPCRKITAPLPEADAGGARNRNATWTTPVHRAFYVLA